MQHDAMSWQVSGPDMVTVRRLSAQSRRLNRAFSSWISSVDNEKDVSLWKRFSDLYHHVV